ncbi:MAG: dihydroneopterin aldolase [Oscillospiraceae bacterium]|nr:dihydroneopterin aldolase [Oscillospiraceae bacterium]
MMDLIKIAGLRVFAYHGVLPEEKSGGQEFLLDITLHMDLSAACRSDNLDDTVNYDAVCCVAHDAMTNHARNLIEAAAQDIADAILREFELLKAVDITLHKPNAPLTHEAGCVSVCISRTR